MKRKGQTERRPPVKNMQIVLPEDLHYLLKIKAAEERTTLKDYVIETLRKSVEKGGSRKE
jgi:predicted HicB family RNase H-like nuclease